MNANLFGQLNELITNVDSVVLSQNDIERLIRQQRDSIKFSKYIDGELNFFINKGVIQIGNREKAVFIYQNCRLFLAIGEMPYNSFILIEIDKECFKDNSIMIKICGGLDKYQGKIQYDKLIIDEIAEKIISQRVELCCETLMFFSEYKQTKVVKTKELKKHKKYNRKINKSKNNHTVKLTKIIYEIEQNEEIFEEVVKRPIARHTESWTVRGHWRITKTGKEVWVKPHVKGNGDIKPKNYKI